MSLFTLELYFPFQNIKSFLFEGGHRSLLICETQGVGPKSYSQQQLVGVLLGGDWTAGIPATAGSGRQWFRP